MYGSYIDVNVARLCALLCALNLYSGVNSTNSSSSQSELEDVQPRTQVQPHLLANKEGEYPQYQRKYRAIHNTLVAVDSFRCTSKYLFPWLLL